MYYIILKLFNSKLAVRQLDSKYYETDKRNLTALALKTHRVTFT